MKRYRTHALRNEIDFNENSYCF